MSTRDQLRAAIDRLPDDRLAELLAVAERLGEATPEPADAPPDLAAQHDHYLYGTPKR